MGRIGLMALMLAGLLLSSGCSQSRNGVPSSRAAGYPVVIARYGQSATVATLPDANPAEQNAADELAKYLSRMTGARVNREQLALPRAGAILVVQGASEPDDGYTIGIDNGGIVITGANERSTLQGTYRLLHELGCRFLAPQYYHYNGSAEIVPASPDLVLALRRPIQAKAKLKYRKLYVEEGHSHDEANLRQMIEWMPKVGYNVLVVPTDYQGRGRVKWDNWRDALTPELQKRGIIIEVGGHGYQNFLNAEMEDGTLFQKHPEYFGQDPQGRRRPQHGWALCTSNPDAVAYLTKNFVAYVKDRPEIQIFDFWPPDGVRWCECENCKALGSPSDRQAHLVNHVREQVVKVRPDLKMEAIAYQRLIVPPEQTELHPDVLVDFCPIRQNFEFNLFDPEAPKQRADASSPTNHEYVAGLKAWREAFEGDISIYSYYRRYAWDSLPLVLPRFMQREVKWYAGLPVQGISVYSEPDDWFTYELNHYVLPQLAWDPDANVEALIDDYCAARYGEAKRPAKAALEAMEQTVNKYCSVPFVSLKSAGEIEQAKAKLDAAAEAVEQAHAAARDPNVKHNLARLLLPLEYARRDLAIQKMRADGAATDEIRAEATELHKFLAARADQGTFLVKNHRLALPRLLTHYGIKPGTGE